MLIFVQIIIGIVSVSLVASGAYQFTKHSNKAEYRKHFVNDKFMQIDQLIKKVEVQTPYFKDDLHVQQACAKFYRLNEHCTQAGINNLILPAQTIGQVAWLEAFLQSTEANDWNDSENVKYELIEAFDSFSRTLQDALNIKTKKQEIDDKVQDLDRWATVKKKGYKNRM